jgi:hypothetical protein
MNYSTDSLVLYIEEYESHTHYEYSEIDESSYPEKINIDNRIFIIYDSLNHRYFFTGKRNVGDTYSYFCNHIDDLIKFIKIGISPFNHYQITLYNYKNLPNTCEEIDFSFLLKHKHFHNEISGYDNLKIHETKSKNSISKLASFLKILKNIYNPYEL